MKKNQSKTKRQSLKEDKIKADKFYNSGFDHITSKHICLKCNRVGSSSFVCCNENSVLLGKVPRTPKKNASRPKWKKFYSYMKYIREEYSKWSGKSMKDEDSFQLVYKKYNLI